MEHLTSRILKQRLSESHYIDENLANLICESYAEHRLCLKWYVLRTEEATKRMYKIIAELAYFGFRCVIEEQQSLYSRNPEFDDNPPDTYVPMQYYIVSIYFFY